MQTLDHAATGTLEMPTTTVVALRPPTETPVRRVVRGMSTSDKLDVLGAAVSALSTSLLLFGRLTPLDGVFGFIVASFLLFLAIYALLTSLHDGRPAVVDKVMTVLLGASAVAVAIALVSVVAFTIWKGHEALFHINFYTQDMSRTGPADPITQGGISHAIVGTLLIISVSILVTVPLGLACAVFMNESRSRGARIVRTIVDAMTALPSIVAGLFIFAALVLVLGLERCSLAASLAVSIMMLPIIIRSADVVLRLVPGNLREASAALGAPTWRTVWHVVLPTARSGLATAVILGTARGLGETAPVLLTSGVGTSLNLNLTKHPMMSLPLATLLFVKSPQQAMVQRGFATAAVLMIVVLVLFTFARIVGGHPAGHLTGRKLRRASERSKRDAARFDRMQGAA